MKAKIAFLWLITLPLIHTIGCQEEFDTFAVKDIQTSKDSDRRVNVLIKEEPVLAPDPGPVLEEVASVVEPMPALGPIIDIPPNVESWRFARSVFDPLLDIPVAHHRYVGTYGQLPARFGKGPFWYSFVTPEDDF